MRVVAAGRSDVGRRRESNEDTYAIVADLNLFVVADGMGGHAAGKVASELAVSGFVRELCDESKTGDSPHARMHAAFAAANQLVFERSLSDPTLAGMGTTLVALQVDGTRARLCHVGDSRLYLLRAGRFECLTEDHTVVCELVRSGRITAEQARVHPHRHFVTRAVGVAPTTDPDFAEIELEPGDQLLLCSDGITGAIEDPEIREILLAPRDELVEPVVRLLDLANERGGDDNATGLLVAVEA